MHVKPAYRPKITGSGDVNKVFSETWDHTLEHHESFRLMLPNRSNKVPGITTISTGEIAGTITDMHINFQYARKANECSNSIDHNHLSGETWPSEPLSRITQYIKEVGLILDIFVHSCLLNELQKSGL